MSPRESKNQVSRSRYREVFLALAISSLVSAVVLAGGFVGDRQEQSGGIVLTGIVSDTTCGYLHGAGTRGDAVCTRDCVSYGAGYALAVGKTGLLPARSPAHAGQICGRDCHRNGQGTWTRYGCRGVRDSCDCRQSWTRTRVDDGHLRVLGGLVQQAYRG